MGTFFKTISIAHKWYTFDKKKFKHVLSIYPLFVDKNLSSVPTVKNDTPKYKARSINLSSILFRKFSIENNASFDNYDCLGYSCISLPIEKVEILVIFSESQT